MLLFRYFLKQFFLRFSLYFIGLVPLFASCDLVVRLASIPFSFKIIKFFGFMLPMVSVFAVPIASCLAIGTTVGNLFVRDELLFFHFFKTARFDLKKAAFVFSLVLLIFYIPILFESAPASYWNAKRFLMRTVQLQIEGLPPQKFHNIASRCTIFFKNKKRLPENKTEFEEIILMAREKNNKEYLVVANSGVLNTGNLKFFNGTIYNNDKKSYYVATFESLEIDFEKIFFDAENKIKKPAKFLNWSELKSSYKKNDSAWIELHKRVGQVVWQFLLPFMIMFLVIAFGRKKSNILLSIIVSSAMFLFSYISLNMGYFFLNRSLLPLMAFYGLPVFITLVFYGFYRSKWE